MTPTCGFFGFKGNGKTLGMTERILKTLFIYPETELYSNYFIDIEVFKRLYIARIMETPDACIIGMDELDKIIHARISNAYINIGLANMISQLRKTGRMIYFALQLTRALDVIWRELLDYLVVCYRIPNGEDNWRYYDFGFEWHITRTGEVIQKHAKYSYMEQFFDYFNTYEVVTPRYWSRVEYDLYEGDWQMMEQRAHDLAMKIKDKMRHNTKIEVSIQLKKAGFNPIWKDEVYDQLQDILKEERNW